MAQAYGVLMCYTPPSATARELATPISLALSVAGWWVGALSVKVPVVAHLPLMPRALLLNL